MTAGSGTLRTRSNGCCRMARVVQPGRTHLGLLEKGFPAGVKIRNSIYRFDDDMFVDTHVYGSIAAHAPVLHLRRLSDGDLGTYAESFDVIWNQSKPAPRGL
jgi:hypothetical protein